MFIDNKYTRWYNNLICAARNRTEISGYIERHHIIPKSLGGTNDNENLIYLTAKEHFIAHHLLTKMCEEEIDKRKMWNAFFIMHRNPAKEDRFYTGRTYELSKKMMAEGKKKFFSGNNNHFYGKTHSNETKKKMSFNWNRAAVRSHDKRKYIFVHDEYGKHYCTRKVLCEKFDLNQKYIYTIVSKRGKTTNGWRILWENEVISNE